MYGALLVASLVDQVDNNSKGRNDSDGGRRADKAGRAAIARRTTHRRTIKGGVIILVNNAFATVLFIPRNAIARTDGFSVTSVAFAFKVEACVSTRVFAAAIATVAAKISEPALDASALQISSDVLTNVTAEVERLQVNRTTTPLLIAAGAHLALGFREHLTGCQSKRPRNGRHKGICKQARSENQVIQLNTKDKSYTVIKQALLHIESQMSVLPIMSSSSARRRC